MRIVRQSSMSKKARMKVEKLGRFMLYILGHNPDEFGLVPDRDGFVSFKELLWAIHEEPGWGYVRQANLNEVLLGKDRPLFEVIDNRIRALDRHWALDTDVPVESLPKLLFISVRQRAHAHVLEKGLRPGRGTHLVLAPDEETALRIGRRGDRSPVLLEIRAQQAQIEGTAFFTFGRLYLAEEMPARFIHGPPLPKEPIKPTGKEKERQPTEAIDFQPGTFVLEPGRDPAPQRRGKGKKEKGWKEEARRMRRKQKH